MTIAGDEGPPTSPATAQETDAPQPDTPRPYQPRPPLWQPAEKPTSVLQVALIAVVGLLGIAAVAVVLFESLAFSGPATATPVTITAIEAATHAREESPSRFVYRVSLADGRTARLASERAHQPGTRLVAMVSRGRLTGRTFVASPYVVEPDER